MTAKKKVSTPPTLSAQQCDCLSWGDSFFLYLERQGQPLSIAAICEFEGDITARDCARFVESKLHLMPRYRQRVVFPPFNVGLPVWEFDPNFEVGHHIRERKLKQGSDAELKAEVGKVLSTILDRERPLWDFTLFRGLQGNRTAILARVHHCLADGIAGVRLIHVLMDTEPHPPLPPKRDPLETPTPRDSGSLLLDGLFRSYFSVVERFLGMQAEIFQVAQHLLSQRAEGAKPAAGDSAAGCNLPAQLETLTELASLTDRLPFNRVCWGPHNIAWTEISMDEIKKVKNVFGTTVNNVLLAVLTSAIRRYSKAHGVNLEGRQMRVAVPVNVRGDDSPEHLGNRITFLPINLPLDISDETRLLQAIHSKIEIYKTAKVAGMVGLLGNVIGVLPTTFQAMAAPILSQLPLNLINTIITNVPGPQKPLYVAGHKMTRWYPVVPIGGEMSMNIAMLSYNGSVYIGFHGTVEAMPDIEVLERLVQKSFAALRKAGEQAPEQKKAGGTTNAAEKARGRIQRPATLSSKPPAKRKAAVAKSAAKPKRKPGTRTSAADKTTPGPGPTPTAATKPTVIPVPTVEPAKEEEPVWTAGVA